MRTKNAKTIYLKDYRPPDYLVDDVELVFELLPESTRVTSRLQIRRNPASEAVKPPLILDGEELELQAVQLEQQPLDKDAYECDEGSLTIHDVPDRFTLTTQVIIYPERNTALEGLYRSGGLYCTQCEAEGFRRITYYLDRPDVMARFTTTIIASKAESPVLLSNGNPIEERELEDGRHLVRWQDPFPKPCYLFAMVAGDLLYQQDRYTTRSGREVELRIYVEAENIDRCDHAMNSLKRAMAWDEEQYGREYDLDIYMIVAVNDFNMGAMENKGLNIFNSKYVLARADTATDNDYQGIEGVIAHEYFHNWTGNRITCRDWFQLSLKEGLTVFRDQEFSADMGSRGVKRIDDVRLLRSHQFAEDAGPMAHPVRPDSYMEINNFYTVTVYEKGAEVVRMQAKLLGPARYREATDLYFERHDGEAVTTDDFIRCMEDVSGRSLEQFRLWYSQSGTPVVEVNAEYDAQQGSFSFAFRQHCPDTPGQQDKEPFHIPIEVALLDRRGDELPLQLHHETEPQGTRRLLELTQAEQDFTFVGLGERPVPSLLRGFSAPVKLRYRASDEELMFLIARDGDAFNRWDASQALALRTLLNLVADYRAGRSLVLAEGLAQAFESALSDESSDKALLSELLRLPGESTLGDQMEVVDVEGIHHVREWLKQALASRMRPILLTVYRRNGAQSPYDITPASIARRRLRNLVLDYLMHLPDAELHQLCYAQFQQADNMTDVMAALSCLANTDCPQRELALAAFEKQWRGEPLVMDKWFSVQASSRLPGTLRRVKALMNHPAFSLRNPNKVRSLVGVFCGININAFHRADGSGYAFLTDQVIALDRLNPQIAARMMRIMSRWRRYDAQRQALMREQFERVLSASDISKDVYEIASKSLADVDGSE
ncbi:MAG: aminopeptidase N [Candidatus Thiodiazotropha sp.]|nr:aminopeptidase N [Candidatus Thiodiazotropha taylori]MBT3057452.1 aminopeptidase N [Candidatus Thiodiazotropha sp. (ex Lucina pensylvanica)]PUB73936.1 MAG: aminopeptidase N [gamma proteobacterium symbiont of Ctena orbiculata]